MGLQKSQIWLKVLNNNVDLLLMDYSSSLKLDHIFIPGVGLEFFFFASDFSFSWSKALDIRLIVLGWWAELL